MLIVARICWIWRNQESIEKNYRPICPCLWQEIPSHRLLGKMPDNEERRQTPMIPDEVLLKLWNVSMDYLENRSTYLLKLLDVRSQIYCAASRNDESETLRFRRAWDCWRNAIKRSAATLNLGQDEFLVRGRGHFRTEINNLQAAAIFILGLVFGGRLSSLISLNPGCIKEVIGHNGQTTIWIKGRLFKIRGERLADVSSALHEKLQETWLIQKDLVEQQNLAAAWRKKIYKVIGKPDPGELHSRSSNPSRLTPWNLLLRNCGPLCTLGTFRACSSMVRAEDS
jgi:hypothetical protein